MGWMDRWIVCMEDTLLVRSSFGGAVWLRDGGQMRVFGTSDWLSGTGY